MKLRTCVTNGLRAAAAALLLCAGATTAPAAEEGFTPLFNGKDLTGWTGDPKLWSVVNGEIVGATNGIKLEKNTFLSTEKSYSDFVLRVKVKLGNHNSGIQFRSEQLPNYGVKGYQADVAEETYFGMLYEEQGRGILPYWNEYSDDERKAVFAAAKLDDWNQYEITCQGDHVKIVLNGYTTLDFKDPEGAKAGIIALQLHTGPDMVVHFKDLEIKELGEKTAGKAGALMPDAEAREEKLAYLGEPFRLPEGFSIEEVATNELAGSLINLTFDPLGRPVVGAEAGGVFTLLDRDGDGRFEGREAITESISRVMGMHFLAPGDLVVQGEGPQGPGLYRLTDDNGQGGTSLLMPSDGGMGEHGPHAIVPGYDGDLYLIYGNHAHPMAALNPDSPSRDLREDHLLPRYVDPRGHATEVMAPGGTIVRVDREFSRWEQVAGGFRNAYDLDVDRNGEIMTFDSDMEWDVGLPWFRPVRVVHAVPGGDYGWRTGSSKMPAWYPDTLPPVDDVGRGSPVGVCFYDHDAFPPEYRGAFFMGDWSRGRIRVLFPRAAGATFSGEAVDFLVGEPLNVTDLAVAPTGDLYFTTGGRETRGGLYRVRHGRGTRTPDTPSTLEEILSLPVHRSAWGREQLRAAREAMGESWTTGLVGVTRNTGAEAGDRVRALELLQSHGPQPELPLLMALARDPDAEVRAAAVMLLGRHPLNAVRQSLINALFDKDPVVLRRACEALVRAGLSESTRVDTHEGLISGLYLLLDHEDRFVRQAAREAMGRMHRDLWDDAIFSDELARRPRGVLEGTLALIETQRAAVHADRIYAHLDALSQQPMDDETLRPFLRIVQLAFIRDVTGGDRNETFRAALGQRLLTRFPHLDATINRELQTLLAWLQPPGTVEALVALLGPERTQEEQIHTLYALRAVERGWTPETRARAVAWFDRTWTFTGGASLDGYIENMWDSLMERLPEPERAMAEMRRETARLQRQEAARALLAEIEGETPEGAGELAHMSFEELSEFLEYDPMAYVPQDLKAGERVFVKARCATCHVFGEVGKGGGPDLSTVTSRFRRRDILEAIMQPSKVVSDQYTGVVVELDDFTTVTGMVAGETTKTLTVITITGERMELSKRSIVRRETSKQSMMPEGLLNGLSLEELVKLFYFLENGGGEK